MVEIITESEWVVLPFAFSDIVPVRGRHLIPLAFVLSLFASLVVPAPLSMAVPVAYAAVNLIASAQIAIRKRRPSYLILVPITFLSLHVAYGLGSAWGLLQLIGHKSHHLARMLKHGWRTASAYVKEIP